MFTEYPAYDRYRTLRLTSPLMRGEDVFALQQALLGLGYSVGASGADGLLGKDTVAAVKKAQSDNSITADGLAGGQTQRTLTIVTLLPIQSKAGIILGALKGQLEHESGFRLGNYSEKHVRLDGTWSYDIGVAQRNSRVFTDIEGSYTPKTAIQTLAARIKKYHGFFTGLSSTRQWQLAQASWNAPAWACWLARREGATSVPNGELPVRDPTPEDIVTLENYIASVSSYYA